MQQIMITGNLGRDPEFRYTPNGHGYVKFTVAVNNTYTREGETVKETYWYNVTAWGKQAEACNQYLSKGNKVLVIGKLQGDPKTGGPRIWTGQQDQLPRASFEISASQVEFLSTPDRGPAQPAERPAAETVAAPAAEAEDELPF